jgi:hypothetical protein
MSAQHELKLGDVVQVRVAEHHEPVPMISIVSANPMNAGGGIALVTYRQPDDRALALSMAAEQDLLEALQLVVDKFGTDYELCREQEFAICVARAAIAKAT